MCASSACAGDLVAQFHVDQWFWTSLKVWDESIMPTSGRASYVLWRPVANIESVRNRQTGQIYVPGTDYTLQGNQLVIPAGSAIPLTDPAWINSADPTTPAMWQPTTKAGTPLRISNDYQSKQIAATYSTPLYQPAPPLVSSYPAKFLAKLAAGQKVAITIEGDSITAGLNSTKSMSMAPAQPGYVDLVIAYLSQHYPGQVYVRNHAVGGYTSGSVLSNASANLADVASDLVIVAVGMNDMAGSITGAQFQSNLQQIIAAARWCNSATEVLLVSSWPSNPDWTLTNNQAFVDYNAAMYQLAGSTQGVSVADVTSAVWNSEMLNTKSFYDVTGNGVNHPNDWMYTLYAQTVLKSILGM